MGLFSNIGKANPAQGDPAYQAAWASFDPSNPYQLSPELFNYISNGGSGVSADGKYRFLPNNLSAEAGGGTDGYTLYGTGTLQNYNNDGTFRSSGVHDNNWGALLPLGAAALGALAFSGAGAGAGAAGGGAGGAGGAAGAGVTGLADGAALDAMYGGAAMGGGGSLAGSALGSTAAMGAGAGGMSGLGGLGSLGSTITSALGGGGSSLLGLGATALGALGGAQGQNASQSSTRSMDPRMDALFYGDLAPKTQGLLASQMPAAQSAGNQMLSVGSGLLGTNRTPDVFGSQFYQGAANDLQRRTADLLAENNAAIRGNAVMTGGLGGSRQGVAQGVAAGKAADSLQGNLSQLALGQYNQDANRALQSITLGSGLMNQGLNTQFQPLQNTASVYQPFTGYGSTTNSTQSGGGLMGGLGGALGAAQLAKNMGWTGSGTSTGGWW